MNAPILCVVGARPNLMKIAPVLRALRAAEVPARLLHTGQHYDADMNDQFFAALDIPPPQINLQVGSGTHAAQTAEIMRRFEPVLDAERAGAVLVVGDVNSTLACALVAVKKAVPVVHVEAGLRSFDRSMPEEINRVLTDQISELLFTTEQAAAANLEREGVPLSRVRFVGNVMIDTLHHSLQRAVPAQRTLGRHGAPAGWSERPYAALTLHRPSNVDDETTLRDILQTLGEAARRLPIAFAMHPRTRAKVDEFGLQPLLRAPGLLVLPPLGYFEMLGLMRSAKVVLTDSGGVQEETTALGVPCITLRESTERPITVDEGTNVIVGRRRERILAALDEVLKSGGKAGRVPQLWDGRAAERIAATLQGWMRERSA